LNSFCNIFYFQEFEGVKTAAATTASEMAAFAKANDGVLFAPLGEVPFPSFSSFSSFLPSLAPF